MFIDPISPRALREKEDAVPIFGEIITAPAACTSQAIGGKTGLSHHLTPAQLAAFDILLTKTRHLAPRDVTREDFRHKEIDALTAWLDDTIRHGGTEAHGGRRTSGKVTRHRDMPRTGR